MLYPAYVEIGDDKHAWSVVLPDFEGCFSAADKEEELNTAVQEAVELYFEDEDLNVPTPSKIADLKKRKEFDYDGIWMLFDVDLSKLSTKAKRFNATLPENLLNEIDSYVAENGMTRSGFLAEASRLKLQDKR